MKRLMVLASVVVAGMVSANCSNSHDGSSSASLLAPSAVDGAGGTVSTTAKGGGGKPGGGGTTGGGGSLSLVVMTDVNGDGLANYGDTITYDVSTTATTQPIVVTACRQNGTLVFSETGLFYDLNNPYPWSKTMTLGSLKWTGGGASCSATLEFQDGASIRVLTTISFNVGA